LYVLGKRVTHCYPYVPTAYLTSLSCAIFSYDKKLFFGLTADAQAVPDLNQHFKPLLEQAFKELRKAAGVSKSKVSLAG
jgi:diacylglycerol O-acyltransferase